LLKTHHHYYFYRFADLEELSSMCEGTNFDIIVVNPSMVQNKQKAFIRIKRKMPKVFWMALLYSYYDNELLNLFDTILSVTDAPENMLACFEKACISCRCAVEQGKNKLLSDREIEVLVALTKGLTNKEIADLMNISVHTVMTHRKNIIEKTGLHSLPALTMYALSKKLISFDS
jgi:DNA-binding NarL/FixJ family response regulator